MTASEARLDITIHGYTLKAHLTKNVREFSSCIFLAWMVIEMVEVISRYSEAVTVVHLLSNCYT